MALMSRPKQRTAQAVVAERLACDGGAERPRPGPQSVDAGTSNVRQAILPSKGPKVAAQD